MLALALMIAFMYSGDLFNEIAKLMLACNENLGFWNARTEIHMQHLVNPIYSILSLKPAHMYK